MPVAGYAVVELWGGDGGIDQAVPLHAKYGKWVD